MLPVNPEYHLPIVFTPSAKIGILSWWTRLADLFGRNQTRRSSERFGRLGPLIERITGFALVVEFFYPPRIFFFHPADVDGREPVRSRVKDERRHDLRPSVGLNAHVDQIIGDDFGSFDAFHLCGWADMQVFADPTENDAWLTIW